MDKNNKSIGIFDSGIGGLTVAKEIISHLPGENIIYLGDTARVPYGTKSSRTVIKYAESNVNFLISKGIKILVVACNTASAYAIKGLKEKLDIPVIGVIEPGARKALELTKNNNVGIIGTPSTINSKEYTKKLNSINPNTQILTKACPLFVPLAEEGWQDEDISKAVAVKYLSKLKASGIDVLILGCTHYPLLKKTIGTVMGNNVDLIDSAEQIAIETKRTLIDNNLISKSNSNGKKEFYLTDISETFISVASNFLGEDLKDVQIVDIV